MKKLILILLTVIALLLVGCTNGQGGDTTTDSSSDTLSEESTNAELDTAAGDTTANESEETTVTDERRLDLSQYKIVVSEYASDWERDAADAISAMFGGLEIINDKTDATDSEIIVGYTKRADNPTDEFNSIGKNGYYVSLKGTKLLVAANSADGIAKAVEFVRENVVDGKYFNDAATKVVEEETTAPVNSLSGEWGDTISYASTLANTISEGFTDKGRNGLSFSNLNMSLDYNLSGANKLVAALRNSDGVPYFTNSSDVFVTSKSGNTLYASESELNGRMNTYRMGYYYRDVHILEQTFSKINVGGEGDSYDVLAKVKELEKNMTTNPKKDDDGVWSYQVTDATDPYVMITTKYDATKYNALKLVVRTQMETGGQIYFVAGSHSGYNAEQCVSFSMPSGEWTTVYIYLGNAVDYKGYVKGIRLDMGVKNDELIEIKSLEAVNITYDGVSVGLDRTYHTYSDKMHEELHFVYLADDDRMKDYGMMVKLETERVLGMRIIDKNGTHESLDGVDWASVEYLGFDINRAGIVGWIKSIDTDSAVFSVELKDGCYVVKLTANTEKSTYKTGDELYLAYRIYTSDSHDFADFLNEGYIERHPLTDIKLNSKTDGAQYLGYDANRGCYTYKINGTDFNVYYKDKNRNFKIDSTITGDDRDRKLYVLGISKSGCLENSVVLSGDSQLLALQVETCKNFCGEMEEPVYDAGDPEYGESIFPIYLGSGESRDFVLIQLYCNWGTYALKQLSSIQFIAPYYHLSCGTTESNCIATYYVYGKDYWTLPDFRSMSAPFWSGQPQHTSIGRLHFLTYTDADGEFYGSENTHDDIDSSGPSYADITMDYISDDGKISATYRHLEFPQYDENRTFYEIKLEILEDLTINDFKNNFSLFSFDGRSYLFRKMGYVNSDNKEVVDDIDVNDRKVSYITLGKDCPYFDYYLCKESGDYVNFALLIKNSTITLNGKVIDNPFVIKNYTDGTLNYCYLTLDLGDITLKAGDTFEINMILMPWGCQDTTNDQSVRTVRKDSCLNPIEIEAITGTVVADDYMPKIMADNNVAEFTLKNGGGTTSVRVYGFDSMDRPSIQYKNDKGEWVDCKISTTDYDGYTVYYDGDGKYSFAFNTDMGTGVTRTYRVSQ